MRIARIIIGLTFAIFPILLTAFIMGMVDLVGMGDGFWYHPLVIFDIILWILTILFWVRIFRDNKKPQP